MSTRTARKYERAGTLPSQLKQPRMMSDNYICR